MFLQPVCNSFCDAWCSRLINGVFRGGTISPQFYTRLVGLIVFPLLFVFGFPTVIGFTPIVLILAALILDFLFMAIYLHALKFIDASVSQALWNLGAVAIPFGGAILFGEAVTLAAALGFSMIVASSLLLDIKDFRRPRLSKGFWLMMLVSALFSAWVLLNKALVDMIGWFDTAFYYRLGVSIVTMAVGFFIWPNGRNLIKNDYPAFKKNFWPFIVYGLVGNVGFFAGVFAFGALPLVVREGISSTQPFFVLMFARFFLLVGLSGAKEDLKTISVIKKTVCFTTMLIGLVLLV